MVMASSSGGKKLDRNRYSSPRSFHPHQRQPPSHNRQQLPSHKNNITSQRTCTGTNEYSRQRLRCRTLWAATAMTTEEIQLAAIVALIQLGDRAARGLYPFHLEPQRWLVAHACASRNALTLRLQPHLPRWTRSVCAQVSRRGFAVHRLRRNIAPGGSLPALEAASPLSGEHDAGGCQRRWHFIHLTTTLHRVGVSVFVDANGWIWFHRGHGQLERMVAA